MPQVGDLNKTSFDPVSGSTISWPDSIADILIVIDNSATLAELTIPFKPDPIDGQLMLISTRSAITSLTLTSAKPIRGLISGTAAGGIVGWIFDTARDAWFVYFPCWMTKTQVGLSNVDNTSDANKPVNSAMQAAIDAKLAPNGNGSSLTNLAKSQVGLGNVDNTADSAKPISTAMQTALDTKLATNGNGGSLTGLTKTQVGLANVDNTADTAKPVSTAQQTALDLKLGVGTVANVVFSRVTGSNATTTGQALVDVTGLSNALVANAVYEFEAVLSVSTSAVTTGTAYGVNYSAAGATIESHIIGASSTTATKTLRISAFNSATPIYLAGSAQTGGITIRGIVATGANAGNLTVQHLKLTSGTSTVFINSFLRTIRIS